MFRVLWREEGDRYYDAKYRVRELINSGHDDVYIETASWKRYPSVKWRNSDD